MGVLRPQAIVQFLRRRKQLEEEIAELSKCQKVVRAATKPNASNRNGSWRQLLNQTASAIDQIDKLLASDGIRLPKPERWWE